MNQSAFVRSRLSVALYLLPLLFSCKSEPPGAATGPASQSPSSQQAGHPGAVTPMADPDLGLTPEMMKCTEDADCVVLGGDCGAERRFSVNKRYQEQIAAKIHLRAAAMDCAPELPVKRETWVATCSQGRCQVRSEKEAEVSGSKVCDQLKERVEKAISAANSCKTDKDCRLIGLGCPFGCSTPLAVKADVSPIRALVAKFNESCQSCRYRCPAGDWKVRCKKSKCVSM